MSTMVLIIFAGALGGAVMTWGSTIPAEEQEAITGCQNVELKVLSINDKTSVCRSENQMNFILQNIGKKEISLKITIIGEKDINKYNYEESIEAGDILRTSTELNSQENILKAVFVPSTKEGLCAEKSIEVDNIATC